MSKVDEAIARFTEYNNRQAAALRDALAAKAESDRLLQEYLASDAANDAEQIQAALAEQDELFAAKVNGVIDALEGTASSPETPTVGDPDVQEPVVPGEPVPAGDPLTAENLATAPGGEQEPPAVDPVPPADLGPGHDVVVPAEGDDARPSEIQSGVVPDPSVPVETEPAAPASTEEPAASDESSPVESPADTDGDQASSDQ